MKTKQPTIAGTSPWLDVKKELLEDCRKIVMWHTCSNVSATNIILEVFGNQLDKAMKSALEEVEKHAKPYLFTKSSTKEVMAVPIYWISKLKKDYE